MFADLHLLAPADEHTGNALLCFLSQDTFVGFVELQAEGRRQILKLNGSESLTECDRTLCNAQDCCGDKAYLVTASSQSLHGARARRAPPRARALHAPACPPRAPPRMPQARPTPTRAHPTLVPRPIANQASASAPS